MFGFLKQLLGKGAEPAAGKAPEQLRASPQKGPIAAGAGSNRAAPRVNRAPSISGTSVQSNSLEIPLQPILRGLPLELQPRLKYVNVGELTISVPLEKVLSQLSQGAVKITFGELRRSASQVFAPGDDKDKTLVPLPLSEVLPRLNPAYLVRRRNKRQVELPQEINGPFGKFGLNPAFATAPSRPEPIPMPEPPAAMPTSSPQVELPPARPSAPAVAASTFAFTQKAPIKAQPAPTPGPLPSRPAIKFSPAPSAPAAIPMPAPVMPAASRPHPALEGTPFVAEAQPSMPSPAPAAPIYTESPAAPPANQPASQQPAFRPASTEVILVGLTSVAESWPEAVRKEIVDQNLVDGKVALPFDQVEQALRQGRINFSWKAIRSWLRPGAVHPSTQEGVILELPLKVVAPLFLTRQQEAKNAKQKVSVAADIPNLFFDAPPPANPPAAENAEASEASQASEAPKPPSDTNIYVWEDNGEAVQEVAPVAPPSKTSTGTTFFTKRATPNEIVARAAALEGVSGALIALPDGLMVASHLAPDLNGDTLAAFLPHIFGKVSQCTKELRMGELNNLNFTVGNIPWKIFRVNAIYFAALGRAGQPLPTAQLAALANELDHRMK